MGNHGLMRPTAWMMYASAALHFVAPFVSGFSTGALMLVGGGVMWAVIGWVLVTRGWRWLAWCGFFAALFGMIVGLVGVAGVPDWVTSGFALADMLAAVGLFVVLWGDGPVEA